MNMVLCIPIVLTCPHWRDGQSEMLDDIAMHVQLNFALVLIKSFSQSFPQAVPQ